MNIPNNHTVLDLAKVQHGTFFYTNQYGQQCRCVPRGPTVRGQLITKSYAFPHVEYPCETEIERATRLQLLDVWKAIVQFQLTANHTITYTGSKAIVMWKAWTSRIFSKKKGRK